MLPLLTIEHSCHSVQPADQALPYQLRTTTDIHDFPIIPSARCHQSCLHSLIERQHDCTCHTSLRPDQPSTRKTVRSHFEPTTASASPSTSARGMSTITDILSTQFRPSWSSQILSGEELRGQAHRTANCTARLRANPCVLTCR